MELYAYVVRFGVDTGNRLARNIEDRRAPAAGRVNRCRHRADTVGNGAQWTIQGINRGQQLSSCIKRTLARSMRGSERHSCSIEDLRDKQRTTVLHSTDEHHELS